MTVRASLALLAALLVVVSAASGAPAGSTPYCLSKGDGFQQRSFTAADGVPLRGISTGKGSLGLVLGHEVSGDSCEWYGMAKVFADRGYLVLAIDFRGFGLSAVPRKGSTTAFGADIGGATAELRRLGAKRVVAIGSSMGGTAVVIAAATPSYHLAGVVSISGAGEFWGNNALQASRHLAIPARFIAARKDIAFADDARTMEKRAPTRDKGLLILPGGTHGTRLLEFPDTQSRARTFVLAFLRRIAARA